MSQRDFDPFLWDMADAAEAILRYTRRKTFDEYMSQKITRDAVERQFTILGEAWNKAMKTRPDLGLQGTRDIIGFRNILVHSYYEIDHTKVWRIIQDHLRLLLTAVRALLGPASAEV